MLIPKVDEELCIGCGNCESLCPNVFKVEEDQKSHVIDPKGCSECNCQEAADSCPVSAITLEEGEV
ncbi:MAG: ferredoxin [Nitrospirae bacterium]|jgi:ferredoxin|nr:ferredoxin [Nitrospirota bacterium]